MNDKDDLVFSAYKTLKNGKRIYARSYGLKAFCFKKKLKKNN